MTDDLTIRPMNRLEVDQLLGWATEEGWNPGLHDADIFWQTDSDAFIAAEWNGELIGGGAITAYGQRFGFMGFFIIRPAFRGRGHGNTLWHARKQRLLARLAPDAAIGMDGVFTMQPYYAKGGFVFSHRDIHFEGEGRVLDAPVPQLAPLASFPFAEVAAYDATCFPAPREAFLRTWIRQTDSLALGFEREGRLAGFGVARRCRLGCKIGPLFADNA